MPIPENAPPELLTISVSSHVTLEAEFAAGSELAPGSELGNAELGIVVTHPHPLHGGSMHTPVPQCLFDTARKLGLAALRFNFRGVGASTGTHDKGVGERDDVMAAIDALVERANVTQVVLAGWSFGADVALAVEADPVTGWFAVAAPLSVSPAAEMAAASSPRPKVLAVPEHDQFNAPQAATQTTTGWTNTTILPVAGADHFLAGRLGVIAEFFTDFLEAPGLIQT